MIVFCSLSNSSTQLGFYHQQLSLEPVEVIFVGSYTAHVISFPNLDKEKNT